MAGMASGTTEPGQTPPTLPKEQYMPGSPSSITVT